MQGIDALGLAAVGSVALAAASSVPFVVSFPTSVLSDEDIENLRNLRRIMLLLSILQKTGKLEMVGIPFLLNLHLITI